MPTAPKKPADRKKKVVEEPKLLPEETPGWDLMKPLDEIPVWDQTSLIALLQDAFEDSEKKSDEEIDAMSKEEWELHQAKRGANERSFDVNIIGQLAQAIMPYALDEAAYLKFVSGAGAMERAMNLAMAWVGQMGESGSSAAS
jgi:hypothetical protein